MKSSERRLKLILTPWGGEQQWISQDAVIHVSRRSNLNELICQIAFPCKW